jgi:hypothetical protein
MTDRYVYPKHTHKFMVVVVLVRYSSMH